MLRVTKETHDVKGGAGERLHIVEEEGRMVVLAEPAAETFNMLREQITRAGPADGTCGSRTALGNASDVRQCRSRRQV
jgi:phage FluMu protein gp41